jgi:hypothetical protein
MQARVRWAKPRLKLNKLPNKGRPRGPGIGTLPFWFLPFFQARPPVEKAQFSTVMTKNDAKTKSKIRGFDNFWICNIAGSANIHQLESTGVGNKSISRERERERERERVCVCEGGRVLKNVWIKATGFWFK